MAITTGIVHRLMALRAKVATEKRIIREARTRLASAAEDLRCFEDDCRRRGIDIVVEPVAGHATPTGVGAIHGRTGTDS